MKLLRLQNACLKRWRGLPLRARDLWGWGCLVLVVVRLSTAMAAERQVFRYDAHGHRDPFEPLVTPTGELRTPRSVGGAADVLRIEGILWDAAQPLAIVNGEVRNVGDNVEGCRIIEIQPTAVIVETEQGERTMLSVVVKEDASATEVVKQAHEND